MKHAIPLVAVSTVAGILDSYHADLEVKDNDVMYKHKTWLVLLYFDVPL